MAKVNHNIGSIDSQLGDGNIVTIENFDIKVSTKKTINELNELVDILISQNPENQKLSKIKNEIMAIDVKNTNTIELINLFSLISSVLKKIQINTNKETKDFLLKISSNIKAVEFYISQSLEINNNQKNNVDMFDNDFISSLDEISNNETNDINVLRGDLLSNASKMKDKLSSFTKEQTKLISKQELNIKKQNKQMSSMEKEMLEMKEQLNKAIEESLVDKLTDISNRKGYDIECEKINDLWSKQKNKKGVEVALMVLDIDYFKNINDIYGHLVGDEVLRYIGAIFKRVEKAYIKTHCSRYGGEEFIILSKNMKKDEVVFLAKKIKNTIEKKAFQSKDGLITIPLTISIGISFFEKDKDNTNTVFYCADQALYKAKEKRNSIFVWNTQQQY